MIIAPIFIPTKNRPLKQNTLQTLIAGGFRPQDITLVIEPQELELYREYEKRKVKLKVLPKDDQGIAYVRNFILEQAQLNGLKRYWMLDDDITAFTFKGKKTLAMTAFLEAENTLIQVPKIAQGAMEYGQYAWSAKNELKMIGYCDVAVLMFTDRIGPIRYRPEMNLKEDRDFTIQLLNAGKMTAKAAAVGFTCPKNGSNAGGLSNEYAKEGREAEASRRMEKAWPGICTFRTKPDGRQDVQIDWKAAYRKK